MTGGGTNIGVVGQTVADLLPTVNEGFNWDIIKNRYDESPVGTAMSLHFTDETGEQSVEDIYLGISDGPEIVVLEEMDDSWDYIGAIITYQDFGMRLLDPDDPMTPDRARYQHGGVTIQASEGHSRERTWMVISNVLNIMLESLVYNRENKADGAGGRENPESTEVTN